MGKQLTFNWGNGSSVAGKSVEIATISEKDVSDMVPWGEQFVGNLEITGNEARTEVNVDNHRRKIERIFSQNQIEVVRQERNFSIFKKTVSSDNGHLMMDYFQIMAERMIGVSGIFLVYSRGKFIKPIRAGEKVRFYLVRDREKFSGTVLSRKGLAALWEGEFGLQREGGLYFTPFHTILEAMTQIAVCLVRRKYDLKQENYPRITLESSEARIDHLTTREKIPLRVRIAKSHKIDGKIVLQFEGQSEKISWKGRGVSIPA